MLLVIFKVKLLFRSLVRRFVALKKPEAINENKRTTGGYNY